QGQAGQAGHVNGQYPIAMTSLSGLALLMEGSTVREGKYSANLRKAVAWLVKRQGPRGLIGNPSSSSEGGRYMFGHGYAMLFLACAVGDMDEGKKRDEVIRVLARAVQFGRDAQTGRGGWGYVS